MPINVIPTDIPDLFVIEPQIFKDDRGCFFESFNQKQFEKAIGQNVSFVQDNQSTSKRGVLRGLHYQLEEPQAKLVRVAAGVIFDVAVDLRGNSSTFGRWFGIELSASNAKQLWIPAGFAHGFLTLSTTADVLYKTSNYWFPDHEKCICWSDPELNIAWPKLDVDFIVSAKDARGLSLSHAPKFSGVKE